MLRLLLFGTAWALCVFMLQGVTFAQELQSGGSTPSFGGPLLISGQLLGSEPVANAEEVELSNPNAVAERAASRTRYAGLGREGAVSLAEKVFQIERPSWTAQGAGGEGRIEKYLSETAAVEDTQSGKRLLVESSVPLRSAVGSGQLEPTSLALREEGGAFVPANPVVPISISKTPGGGVSLPLGISVAPAQAAASEGPVAVGDRVVYPATATDTDYMVQALPMGVETSWQLLSEHSSGDNSLVFALPTGASLQMSKDVEGGAEVVREGQALATIPPAIVLEADGAALHASYTVSGETLTTHVDLSGSVAFPVMVDPIIIGYFGSYGAGTWTGWSHFDNCSGCTTTKESSGLLEVGMNPGPGNGTEGQWNIWAPGAGKEGGASIERVDITGIAHQASGQSYFEGWIYKSNGSKPVWTFNGTEGAQGEGALKDGNALSGYAAAFCAQGAGGKDGGEQPLCNENYGGEAFTFANELGPNSRTTYNYSEITGAAVRFLDTMAPNEVKLQEVYEKWSRHGSTGESIHANDQGTGIAALRMEIPPGHVNEHGEPFYEEKVNCTGGNGFDGCPEWVTSGYMKYGELPTGVYTLGVYAEDAAKNIREEQPDPKLYIDNTPPKLTIGGSLAAANGGVVGEGSYELTARAEDGTSAAPQSGIHTVTVYVDGTKVHEEKTTCPEPVGVPEVGCLELEASPWHFEGQQYGSGPHTITVVATDWAGNETTDTIHVTINQAAYQPIGPGVVNLSTGDFRLSTTDVLMSGPNATLSVGRTYDSRNLSQGSTGPLGALWSLSLPDAATSGEWESLKPLPDGNVAVTTASGVEVTFVPNGVGGFTSPVGFQNLTLTEPSKSPVEYRITEASGVATIFTFAGTVHEPKEEEEVEVSLYEPTEVVQPGGANGIDKVTYTFTKTTEGIVEPTQVLAPEPSAGACTPTLVKGCRALTFNYASSTTATGENESEWGDYKGRLTRVYFTAWNPSTSAMTTTTIAQYTYDVHGRLRAEWNPTTSPALKTVYGYDAEGHVTAMSPPGQESWAFSYGAISGDSVTGRLLAATQAAASAPLWTGEAPKSTEAPKITGSTIIGNKMDVSTGKWTGTPVAYGYQWEDCNAEEKECTPIPGATNATYKPTESDDGHTLSALVTATNGGGSVATTVADSALVGTTFEPVYDASYGSEGTGNVQFKSPAGVAFDSKGNIWITDSGNNRVEELNEKGEYVKSFGSAGTANGQFKSPEGIAISSSNNIWVADCENHRVQEFNEKGEYIRQLTGEAYEKLEQPSGVALRGGYVWVTDTAKANIEVFTESGTYETYWGRKEEGANETHSPHGLVFDGGDPWIADSVDNRILGLGSEGESPHELKMAGEIGEYIGGSGAGQLKSPEGIAVDSKGNLWVADTGNSRVQEFGEPGSANSGYMTQFGKYGTGTGKLSSPVAVAVDSKGNVWVADTHNNRIEKWTPSTATSKEGETPPSPAPRWTVEYKVPAWGTGAPHSLTEAEVGTWAQKDDPAQNAATAIFPPDETVGWPATEYRRAMVYYLDSSERVVNIARPSGGISTFEFDAHNNVTRTLSMDDRALALKEGSKSAEVAKQLSTESKYNSEGTELEEALGPEHKVKLPSGSEVSARKQVKYSYEEGAPGGGPYHLVTKTTEDALTSGKEEDKRTVTQSYSGQENLGWKLHKPTSVTTAPGGLNLTHTTLYNSATGDQTETKMPTPGPQVSEYALPSGSKPFAITTGSDKNLWYTDSSTGKVGKITTSGITTEYAANNDEPEGISSGPDGNLWFVEHEIRNVDHITTGGSLTTYTLTHAGTYNVDIVTGPDENMWFTESEDNDIGKINTKDEVLGEYALPSGSKPYGIAVGSDKNLWFTDYGTSKIGKITTSGTITEYALPSGSDPYWITAGPEGDLWFADYGTSKIGKITTSGIITEYSLPTGSDPKGIVEGTEGNVWFTDYGTSKIGKITASGSVTETGLPSGSDPNGITSGPEGNLWFTDYGTSKIGKLNPISQEGNEGARNSQVIYYTPGTEAGVVACQNHPEWANLPCQTQPTHQPETSGLPEIPVTIFTYNIWDETETTKSTSGTATRTETDGYDSAGRITSKETTSTTGTTLPKITYKYNTETGLPSTQSTGSGSEEKKITTEYNKLEQVTQYTDAEGNTATYEYEKEGDARLLKTTDPKGSQAVKYNETTGTVQELTDSAAGKFTATYDVEGNLEGETLPNGMTESLTHNAAGEPTGLEYTKTTHCAENCKWFTDSIVPSIHGQWMSQTSTLSTENYAYDEAGRLTQVQDTPAGKGCATRIYGLEADGNLTNLTKRAPGTGGVCATEGGEVERHKYDTANRLIDTGTSYNAFGDITALPAVDAGGAELTSSFYADGQLSSQTQSGQTIGYNLDPARRTRETVSTGKTTSDVTNHYDGAGTIPSWTSYTSGEWTRNIPGVASGLDAIQYNGEAPVLQLANLHGDIIATVPDSETATKLSSSIDTTEYGVPTVTEPPKYSWLGLSQLSTELPSGVLAMGARSYIPQLGRFLQPDPQPGGSANAYAYTRGNPLNESDPSGEYTITETYGGLSSVATGEGVQLAGGTGIGAGAIMPAPVNTQIEEAFIASPPWDQVTAGAEEYEEYEEEGEYEEASYHPGTKGQQEAHAPQPNQAEEGAVFFQALSGEDENQAGDASSRLLVHRCEQEIGRKSCMSYVGFFGWLKKQVKSGWRWLKKAAKSTWGAIRNSVVNTYHKLGYGDLVCYQTGCADAAAAIYDGYRCAIGDDCEAFGDDIGEYLSEK